MKRMIILSVCIASIAFGATDQHESIDSEISRVINVGCRKYEANDDVFKQDLAYTVKKLHYYLLNDTTPCAKTKIHYLTAVMLNYVDSSNYDIVFQYNLLYVRDSTNNDYNSIVALIRKSIVRKNIKIPPSAAQFIGSPEFYKATTWELPFLISYLDMFGEIENLKNWGKTHSLDELQQEALTVSLVRLGDSTTTQEYVTTTPTRSVEWDSYITGLNYARNKPATERLIKLLDNTEKANFLRYSYSDDPQTYYTTVRTLALETLALMVEDFPMKRLAVPYEDEHFSEASEKDFKIAKRWFKRNRNYKIIRRSNYNYNY
jgi:hypothetical protein